VSERLYVITGSDPAGANTGGNTAVFIAADGVTLVDTKFAMFGPAMLERVRSVTDKPVIRIINTHAHADHTGGNVLLIGKAETIVSAQTDAALVNARNKAPRRTYRERMTIGAGPDQIDLYHFGRGHTDGDTFVVFTALGVMHAGDMFAWKALPMVDTRLGGSILDYPRTLAAAAGTIRNVSIVIPGHRPVLSWSEFVEYGEFMADFVAYATRSATAGRPVTEAAADYVIPSRFIGYAPSVADNLSVSDTLEGAYEELGPR
jgi:glyoxylase-like metal-dependent hydrolase (beta-lactamase superfamily II)